MKKQILEINKRDFMLGGEPFYLASGEIHYFRFFREGWRRRLQLMKDFGLTAVQVYVPWNMHEPEKGEFCFEGNLDLSGFLALCEEMGLYVLFRPSGYICSEWEFGGLPYWLLKEDICIRTSDPGFLAHLRSYYERLAKEFIPYLSTKGGPIIAVAVENEYGSFADDNDYIKAVGDMLTELGVDVPLFTANADTPFKYQVGTRPEYWNGIDCYCAVGEPYKNICEQQPDKPVFVSECWAGITQQWEGCFMRRSAEDVAENYKKQLELGAYINFYMFCGGTNFGFYNGALVGKFGADTPDAPNKYIPFVTSYDLDSLVTENGKTTLKYDLCKDVLADYLKSRGIESSASDSGVMQSYRTQEIHEVELVGAASFFDNLDNISAKIVKSAKPRTFEKLDQDFGFVLYSTHIKYTDDQKRQLKIEGLHDRATVYANGGYIGTYMRDRKLPPIQFTVPRDGVRLDILVENLGRVCYGQEMLNEFKGILGYVHIDILQADGKIYPWNYTFKTGWTNYSLPMKDLSELKYSGAIKKDCPAFYKGLFKAEPGIDTFLDTGNLKKGVVWINGFNLGRYWEVGPQKRLYVPGELLKEENTIEIFELYAADEKPTVFFEAEPELDSIKPNDNLVHSQLG